jgi:beta-galactosidase
MEVFRWCDGTYLEDQDFWRLNGIARGMFLYTREKQRLEDVHILADADGNLTVEAEVTAGITTVKGVLADASGAQVAAFSAPVTGSAGLMVSASLFMLFLLICTGKGRVRVT